MNPPVPNTWSTFKALVKRAERNNSMPYTRLMISCTQNLDVPKRLAVEAGELGSDPFLKVGKGAALGGRTGDFQRGGSRNEVGEGEIVVA